jgi:hypothetical protein
VTQTNNSQAAAGATNANAVGQSATQAQRGGEASGGQLQSVTQTAPATQAAGATSTSVQTEPTNAKVALTIDPAAADPTGSGAIGTLIQIWIPRDVGPTATNAPAPPAATQSSTSATASTGNANQVAQTADQQQDSGGAPSAGTTQLGGGGQTQTIQQTAPSTQSALAEATSTQAGATNAGSGDETNTSTAIASASNDNEVVQSAAQVQRGTDGSQVQLIVQEAPTTQSASATATSTSGSAQTGSSSTASESSSNQTTQSSEQTQDGSGAQVQSSEQTAPSTQLSGADSAAAKKRGDSSGWDGARTVLAPAMFQRSLSGPAKTSSARTSSRPEPQLPQNRPGPVPRPSALLGGSAGSATGGSLWTFALLLTPFALTAPWWARRAGSSVLRRLMSVALRLERPG